MRYGDMNFLLQDTEESFYWMGFIFADGSFSNGKRLRIDLSVKDEQHLQYLALKLNTSYKKFKIRDYEYVSLSLMHTEVANKLIKKFNINKKNKTNPPLNLFIENDNLFISFLIGFIDGDGCIKNQTNRTDSVICLKNHYTWLPIYRQFEDRIYKLVNIQKNYRSKINNAGYASLIFSDSRIVNFLKNKAVQMNLPILNRKWCRINEYRKNKRTLDESKKLIKPLLNKNIRQKDIANMLGISQSYLSQIIKILQERKEI